MDYVLHTDGLTKRYRKFQALDGLTMNDDSNGTTYFGILSKTSYIYRKEGDMLGVDVYPQLKLIVKDRAKQVYETDDFITQTSDNGYQIAYNDITTIIKITPVKMDEPLSKSSILE